MAVQNTRSSEVTKVALVAFDYAEYCSRLAAGLSRTCQVLLLLPDTTAGNVSSFACSGVTLSTFRKPRLRHLVRQLGMIRTIVRRIRDFDPDVVHVQAGHPWFHLALPLLRKFPIVLTVHDLTHHPGDRPSRKTPQPIADLGARHADHVIVHSERIREGALSRLRLPARRVHVVPHIALGGAAT